ncbi:MAG: hypothetical protein OXR84_03340, partial [Magnetovibrio sp.]|nr:hypothetical protein [Magnetovibrio sp.]
MNRVPELVKLPVWRIVRASYLVFVYNPKLSLKLVAIPLAAFIFQVPMLRWMTDSIDLQSGIFTWQVAVVAAYSLLVSALTIPMITAWHRLVLYGHGHPEARLTYSIYSTEWSYLWKIVLYSFVIFGLAIVVAIGLTPFGMIGASLVGEVGDRTGTLDGSPESNRKIFKFAEAATKFVIWG